MLSQHYLISGPSKEASSSTTLTTTTSRRDEYSQGATKDTPTTRELLRSRPNWRRRLNLLLIAVGLLMGTVAAMQEADDIKVDFPAAEYVPPPHEVAPAAAQGVDAAPEDAAPDFPNLGLYPDYFKGLKNPMARQWESEYLDRLIEYRMRQIELAGDATLATIPVVKTLKNAIYDTTMTLHPGVNQESDTKVTIY